MTMRSRNAPTWLAEPIPTHVSALLKDLTEVLRALLDSVPDTARAAFADSATGPGTSWHTPCATSKGQSVKWHLVQSAVRACGAERATL